METKLGRKISNRSDDQFRRVLARPRPRAFRIGIELGDHAPALRDQIRILQPHPQFVFRHLVQNRNGVVIQILPGPRRELLEQFLWLLVPGPPEIAGNALKIGDEFGNFCR